MDSTEIKATIKDMLSNLIRDDAEGARQNLHDVLAAKMRERIAPETPAPEDDQDPDDQDPDNQDPDNQDPE